MTQTTHADPALPLLDLVLRYGSTGLLIASIICAGFAVFWRWWALKGAEPQAVSDAAVRFKKNLLMALMLLVMGILVQHVAPPG